MVLSPGYDECTYAVILALIGLGLVARRLFAHLRGEGQQLDGDIVERLGVVDKVLRLLGAS